MGTDPVVFLPSRAGHVGVTARDNRLFVEAELYRYRAGNPWRDLPEHFGDFRVIHLRHTRWSKSGVWRRVFEVLSQEADNEYAMTGSTIVRLPAQRRGKRGAADIQAIGRSRGGLSTKIHATVDALGNPTGFHLTPGQTHDLDGADVLLAETPAVSVIADHAYDAGARVVEPLQRAGKGIVIPSNPTRKVLREYDDELYKARHLIENFFARLKQYRAIATRYDKTACNFLGAIYLAAAVVWLN